MCVPDAEPRSSDEPMPTCYENEADPVDADKSSLKVRFTDTSLGPIRTLEQGSPDCGDVVLIHGFGGDAENWRFNLSALARHYRVLALDLPGHGDSTKVVGTGAPSVLVDALEEVLEARPIRTSHLVGHSLGGLVAASLAMRSPELCASLALIAPAGLGPAADRRYVEGFVRANTTDEMRVVLEMLFANRALVTAEFAQQVLTSKLRAESQSALELIADQLLALGDQAVVGLDELKHSGIPTMIMWGTDDRVIAPPATSMLHESIAVTLFEGLGHSPHVEAARGVNRTLTDFFGHTRELVSSEA